MLNSRKSHMSVREGQISQVIKMIQLSFPIFVKAYLLRDFKLELELIRESSTTLNLQI